MVPRLYFALLVVVAGLALAVSASLGASRSPRQAAPEPVPEPVYLSPVAVCPSRDGASLYVAEFTAGQVVILDRTSGAVRHVCKLPGRVSGVVPSIDGGLLYVTVAEPAGRVCTVDARTGKRGPDLCEVADAPMSPVLSTDGQTLYVCNRFSSNVSVIDAKTRREICRIPVLREPVAAALTPDGRLLYVANLLPVGPATGGSISASVSVLDTATRSVEREIALPNGSSSVLGLCISPDGKQVFVTHVLGRYNMPTTQLDHGWLNTNALSVIDAAAQKLVGTILVDDEDLGAANPWGVACSPDGKFLCVAHAGTHELSVIDRDGLLQKLAGAVHPEDDLAFLVGLRRRIKLPGKGPRGLCVVGNTAYVAEYFSDNLVSVALDPSLSGRCTSISLGRSAPLNLVRRGELYFHDGSRSFEQWQSCSTCHPDARADGLNWDLLNDGLGNPKNAKSMLLAHRTPPVMITGIRPSAEIAVRAGLKYIEFREPTEEVAAPIDEYLKSLRPEPSPYLVNGKLSAKAQKGQTVFVKAGCICCHSGPLHTDLKPHDVGTGTGSEAGRLFYTPNLVEIWRTAPYLYDGRAPTIRSVFTQFNPDDRHGMTSKLTPEELDELEAYVLSL